jgi:hypothetical protein
MQVGALAHHNNAWIPVSRFRRKTCFFRCSFLIFGVLFITSWYRFSPDHFPLMFLLFSHLCTVCLPALMAASLWRLLFVEYNPSPVVNRSALADFLLFPVCGRLACCTAGAHTRVDVSCLHCDAQTTGFLAEGECYGATFHPWS